LEKLAEHSGLSPHYLSTVETDKRDPSVSTVERVAAAFGIPVADLFATASASSAGAQRVHAQLARLFDNAPSHVQRGVMLILSGRSPSPKVVPGPRAPIARRRIR